MPAAATEVSKSVDAVQNLKENLSSLEDAADADPDDLDFLRSLLEDPEFHSLLRAHDELDDQPPEPTSQKAVGTARDVYAMVDSDSKTNRQAAELCRIIENPHFRALLVSHDDVVNKNFGDEIPDSNQLLEPPPPVFNVITEQVRFVTIRKSNKESLGITVKLDDKDDLIIARILANSLIDRQGLLRVGDIIREVNGYAVATPEHLMEIMADAESTITLKIVPSEKHQTMVEPIYLKAHFSYDPQRDRLLPCKDAGLPFRDGDVLEIVSNEDPNWWQARVVDIDGPTGLIPSQALEEKRKAFVQPDFDYSKGSLLCGLKKRKKKKIKYNTKDSKDFDKCDVMVYEEVRRMAPFERKVLVLVGAHGVGRRSLKERLIRDDPRRFGTAMPHTSRAMREGEVDGKGYHFAERHVMEEDIANNQYIEYGEFNGNLYGTKIDSIYEVIEKNRMCVLDVNPTSLKLLKTKEFMPYVVFIAAPAVEALKVMYEEGRRLASRNRNRQDKNSGVPIMVMQRSEEDFIRTMQESAQIEQIYRGFFDETIVNDNFEETYRQLRKILTKLTTEQQWVPVNWVY